MTLQRNIMTYGILQCIIIVKYVVIVDINFNEMFVLCGGSFRQNIKWNRYIEQK